MDNNTNILSVSIVAMVIVMVGCSKQPTQRTTRACSVLAGSLKGQESAFLDRLGAIRQQHILVREYDRQMIELLASRSAELMRLTDAKEVSGCFGKGLEDLQTEASEENVAIYKHVFTFRQALIMDPENVYVE
jgi:hypothetical protein